MHRPVEHSVVPYPVAIEEEGLVPTPGGEAMLHSPAVSRVDDTPAETVVRERRALVPGRGGDDPTLRIVLESVRVSRRQLDGRGKICGTDLEGEEGPTGAVDLLDEVVRHVVPVPLANGPVAAHLGQTGRQVVR